jgi:hypothetical protein
METSEIFLSFGKPSHCRSRSRSCIELPLGALNRMLIIVLTMFHRTTGGEDSGLTSIFTRERKPKCCVCFFYVFIW